MTPCRSMPIRPQPPQAAADAFAHASLNAFVHSHPSRSITPRPLLLLSGAAQPGDPMLARLSDAELALLRETLDLLNRTGAASAA